MLRAHQTRRSGRNSRPISAKVALPRLQSEIKVALFLFASCSFLANNLRFILKLIDKAIVINVKLHKNERKRLYSNSKENLTCWDTKFLNLYWRNSRGKLNPKSKYNQTDASCTKCVVGLCYIFFIILTQIELYVAFSKVSNQLVKF